MFAKLICLIFLSFPLYGTCQEPLSINELLHSSQQYSGKEVLVRGFFYKRDLEGILSAHPNLKTCCIGSSHQVQNQIFLEGEIPEIETKKPLVFTGIFSIEPSINSTGQLIKLYRLRQLRVVDETNSNHAFITGFSCLAVGIGLLAVLRPKIKA